MVNKTQFKVTLQNSISFMFTKDTYFIFPFPLQTFNQIKPTSHLRKHPTGISINLSFSI